MPTLCLILASGFWLLTGATIATTVADIELTQHCIHRATCREANPLLLSGRKRAYAVPSNDGGLGHPPILSPIFVQSMAQVADADGYGEGDSVGPLTT